jgi:hypothetical protein
MRFIEVLPVMPAKRGQCLQMRTAQKGFNDQAVAWTLAAARWRARKVQSEQGENSLHPELAEEAEGPGFRPRQRRGPDQLLSRSL